ncbi:hypothetical protein [Melittangium boletus]|uniref:Uncharacterized protein n=1 Tax=Melittangium boletus DSM 14713 TaxID=1294270 RepID=A0A286NV94_9BACT|nr:hypothetical protein [Melittangium boletus]ATB27025.1 hypothetical protein MEBOL_000460 [Melittangium boletus DSM 14713]
MRIERNFLPTPVPPQSLCWSGDALVDWVSGGLRHGLDGETLDPHVRYGYRFDAAVMSPDGRYTVLHERLGTKALLLREGELVRELSRSYYHAEVYEYPVALWTLPGGRTLLAHCPDEYCRIELEDAETGEWLTRRDSPPVDVFHSRLQFSRDGRFLLSAGWIWHPVNAAHVFDVTRALEQPSTLDSPVEFSLGDGFVEIHAAAFGARDTVLLECEGLDEAEPGRTHLVVYSPTERRELSRVPLQEPAGTLMPLGERYALCLYQHPRLIELATGRVEERWPELETGRQCGSIIHHIPRPPPLALDPEGGRLAVGTAKGIEVLRFHL